MKIKVGDRIQYWHGLGGAYLKEGVIKRLELQTGVKPGEGILEAQEVLELESMDPWQGAFVDLEDGRWTYAGRVVKVLAGE